MLKHRGYIALGVLLLIGATVAAGLTPLWLSAGPFDPQTASQRQLLRWLVTHDVAEQPLTMQTALVERLIQEFDSGIDGNPSEQLNESYRQRLSSNAQVLKHRWFVTRVEEYSKLPQEQQEPFLDQQIETIVTWTELEASWSPKTGSSNAAQTFFNDIETWMEQEQDRQRHEEMSKAVRSGVIRWLATRDLTDQSLATRRQLAKRIADELDRGFSLSTISSQRPEDETALLHANSLLLTEAWLHELSHQYADLPNPAKAKFIDAQLDKVQRWEILELISKNQQSDTQDSPEQANPTAALMKFAKLANGWIERASNEDQPRLKKLVADVQGRVFFKMLLDSGKSL